MTSEEPWEEEPWDAATWRHNIIKGVAALNAAEMWVNHQDALTRQPPEGYVQALDVALDLTDDEKAFFRETYSKELELLGFQPSRWTLLMRDE